MPWTTLSRACAIAKKSNRPILLVFTITNTRGEPSYNLLDALDNHPGCRDLVARAFSVVRVHTRLPAWNERESVKALKAQFDVEGYPTMIVTRDGKTVVDRLLGCPTPDLIQRFLEGASGEYRLPT